MTEREYRSCDDLHEEVERLRWKPIKSAPRDGTLVDLWVGDHRVPNAFYDSDKWLVVREWRKNGPKWGPGRSWFPVRVNVANPTHWMSVPNPPAALSDQGRE